MRPWYPFYPSDYQADTKFLSDKADLLYRRLLDLYWMNQGPIPLNYSAIARAIGVDVRVLKRYLHSELAPYWIQKNALLFNIRMDAELEISKEKHKLAVEKGKIGGLARAKARAQAKAQALLQSQLHPQVGSTNQDLSKTDTEQFLPPANVPKKSEAPKPEKTYAQDIPYDDIIELYHKHAPSLKPCEKMTMQLMRDIQILWNDKNTGLPDLEHWENFFIDCESSDWLTARTRSKRRAHLLRELVAPETYAKIYEGAYE